MYRKERWDLLMKYCKKFSHHWFAHVVPLYADMFLDLSDDKDAEAVINMVETLGLREAAKTSMGQHLRNSSIDASSILCTASQEQDRKAYGIKTALEADKLGVLCTTMHTTVPMVRSLQKALMMMHGINLAKEMGSKNAWVLPWAHMMACCAQILCVHREGNFMDLGLDWLGKACNDIMERYGSVQKGTDHTLSPFLFLFSFCFILTNNPKTKKQKNKNRNGGCDGLQE